MPFQDKDDLEIAAAPRLPSLPERWLRKVFLEEWGLKLLALGITIVLWLAVTGQNRPVTLRINGVALNFLRPAGFELSNEPPSTVDITFTGSKDKLDRIEPRELIANVDLSDQKAGERSIKLTVGRVKLDLQEDVQVQAFHPGSVSIRLEPIVERALEVEVKFSGKLPEGYELGPVTVSPSKVRLKGPADRVNALSKVVTETVSLDGRKENFSLTGIAINLTDPKIDMLDANVDIHVAVVEKRRGDLHLRFATADQSPLLASLVTPSWLNNPTFHSIFE
jgi:YbbR domain-containing protein